MSGDHNMYCSANTLPRKKEGAKASSGMKLLTQEDLAERWSISVASIERWRSDRMGPNFIKLVGAVRYRIEDVEKFEQECLVVCDGERK